MIYINKSVIKVYPGYIIYPGYPFTFQIGRLCAQLGLKLEIEDACKNKQIIEKVFETFREAAKTGKLHKQEIPSKIYLISEQWTPESGFVTDALKLKRLVRDFLKKKFYRKFVVVKHFTATITAKLQKSTCPFNQVNNLA